MNSILPNSEYLDCFCRELFNRTMICCLTFYPSKEEFLIVTWLSVINAPPQEKHFASILTQPCLYRIHYVLASLLKLVI